MIFLYLSLVLGLGIYEILTLKKKGQVKDIVVFIAGMILAAVVGVVYMSDTFRPSIASYFLAFFNVKG